MKATTGTQSACGNEFANRRYGLRVSMNRNYGGKVQKEVDFAVLIPQPEIEEQPQTSLKLEVRQDQTYLGGN